MATCGHRDANGSLCHAYGGVRRLDRNNTLCGNLDGGCTADKCCYSWPTAGAPITCDFAARSFGVLLGNGITPPLDCAELAPSSKPRNPFASTCSASSQGCKIDECCSPPTCDEYWRNGGTAEAPGAHLCNPTFDGPNARPRMVPDLGASNTRCSSAEKGCNATECCIADPPRLGHLTCKYAAEHYGMTTPSAKHVPVADFETKRCAREFSCDQIECYATTCESVGWQCDRNSSASYHFADPSDPHASPNSASPLIHCLPDPAYANRTSSLCDAATCCRGRARCSDAGVAHQLCVAPRWTPKHSDRECEGPACRVTECCDEWVTCSAAAHCSPINATAWCRNDTQSRGVHPYGCAATVLSLNTSSACCLLPALPRPEESGFFERLGEFVVNGLSFQDFLGAVVVYVVICLIVIGSAFAIVAKKEELNRIRDKTEAQRIKNDQREEHLRSIKLTEKILQTLSSHPQARSDYTIL